MPSSFNENFRDLPRLPVPKLKDTLQKYIKSVKPLVSAEKLKNTIKLVEEFENSEIAAKLQQYIEEKAEEKLNWFEEWYGGRRFLDNRFPIALYGCPAQMFPLQDFKCEDDRLNYSVKLVLGAVQYKILIDSNMLPLDKSGNAVLDMSQYDRIFGTCRIPSSPSDKQEFHPKSEHIIIVYKNQFYKLQVIEYSKPINEKRIFKYLKAIVSENSEREIPIGILTTAARDIWASVHQELIEENYKQLKEIQSSLFLVCLDDPVQKDNSLNKMTKAGKQLIHGGGSEANSGNRWFDKTVQFVIGQDGIVGLVYEHSFCDGQPIASMANYVVEFIRSFDYKKNTLDNGAQINPLKISFHLTDSIQLHIKAAADNFNKSIQNCDIEWFKFDHYGKDFIKNANLSPDSFVQVAIQLAFYRLHKKPAVAYESVSTRKYAKGGTEPLRAFFEESVSFSKIALDLSKTDEEKLQALKLAVNTHKQYSVEAGDGFGTERHLMGLRVAAKEMSTETPSIFLDSSYIKSTTKRLATSQVMTKCDSLMGYGTFPTDLYATCYNLRDYDINFAIYSFRSNQGTNTRNLKNALIVSLCDMQNILLHI